MTPATPTVRRLASRHRRRLVARFAAALVVLAAALGVVSTEAVAGAAAPSVTVDPTRGHPGYCTDGGITVDISTWVPDHHEVKRCAPDVTAADTAFDVLWKAGIVIDGDAHLTSAPTRPGWGFDYYAPVPLVRDDGEVIADGTWTSMTPGELARAHPDTSYLRWGFGDTPTNYEPLPLPTTSRFYVGVSDPAPAAGTTIQIWVTRTLPLEQVTVRVDGRVVSPPDFQTGIDGVTPRLPYPVPVAASGPVTVTATGAYDGRTGTTSFDAGATQPAVAPNPDPGVVSVWRPCQPGTGVTEIVDFNSLGDHDVEVRCALFLPGETVHDLSGMAAMERAGFGDSGTLQYGPAFVCRLRDESGSERPTAEQFACARTPGANSYWSYWHAKPSGTWGYSGSGAIGAAGEIEGWSFSTADGSTVAPRIGPQDAAGYHPATTANEPNPSSRAALASACDYLLGQLPQVDNDPYFNPGNPPPYTNQAFWTYPLAAGRVCPDAATTLRRVLPSDLDNPAGWPTPDSITGTPDVGGDPNVALNAMQFLQVVKDAGVHPADPAAAAAMLHAVESVFDDHGRFDVIGDDGSLGVVTYQAQVLGALAGYRGAVPQRAVDYLLALQNDDGSFDHRPDERGDGDGTDVYDTVLAVDALGELSKAGDTGTAGAAATGAALGAAGRFLARLQRTDGSFPHYDAIDGSNVGVSDHASTARVAGTALIARALAYAGQSDAAVAAVRWLTRFQLTPALAGAGPGKQVAGAVADSAEGLAGLVENDPADIGRSGAGWVTPLTALALATAPYRDPVAAQFTASAATGITASGATIDVATRRGTTSASVTVTYGTGDGPDATTPALHLPASEEPESAPPSTLSFRLAGLRAGTTYRFHATLTDDDSGSPTVGAMQTFATDPHGAAATPDLAAAIAYLTSRGNLVDGDHYEPVAGAPDVGLTIDGAFALAAAHTRGLRGGDAALRRIATFVERHATAWTGIGTRYVSGGSLGKVALLTEMLGRDPHAFAGHDLIGALDGVVCRGSSPAPATDCAAAGNYAGAASVFGQALGVIAQIRAKDDRGARAPARYLQSLQHADGGFPALIPAGAAASDVDSTAIAIMALDLLGDRVARHAVTRGVAWIAAQQLPDGGFPGASGDSVNSAALAIQALSLDGRHRTAVARARLFLAGQQNLDGGFAVAATGGPSDVRASTQAVNGAVGTSYATLSLSGRAVGGGAGGGAHPPRRSDPSTHGGVAGSGPSGSGPSGRGRPLAATGLDGRLLLCFVLLAAVMIATGSSVLASVRRRRRHVIR